MMRIDPKQRNETERAWLDRAGEPINVDRAWAKSDRVIDERALDRRQLEAACGDGPRRWYALRVGHRAEIELRDALKERGVDAVVPEKQVQRKARRPGARGRVIHKPVLRALVFVSITPCNEAFSGLLRVRGVGAIIGTDDRPHPIGEREMSIFMELAQAGAFDERNAPTGLQVGTQVKIRVGSYADFEGVIAGYVGTRSARVSTWLFGREMTIDVKLAHLEKQE